jgi:hypothetical protein
LHHNPQSDGQTTILLERREDRRLQLYGYFGMPSRQQEDLWMSWNRLSSQLTSTNHQVEVTSILVECKALLRSIDGTSEEHNNAFGTKLQILFRLMLALCHRRLHHPYRSWRSATFALDHYRIASLRGMTIESEDQYIPWPSLNEIAYRLEEEMFMTYQALLESCEHTSDKDESEFWSIDSNDALHFHDALLEDERSEETFSEVGVYELRDSPDDLSEPEVTLDEASMGQGATEVVGGEY